MIALMLAAALAVPGPHRHRHALREPHRPDVCWVTFQFGLVPGTNDLVEIGEFKHACTGDISRRLSP